MSEAETEGNSVDRNVFLFLILAALFVLKRRKVDWWALISSNRWLVLFYIFFGLSIMWSDYPFVAFKRWFKDLGNVVMVLIILTEKNPVEAVRAVFARCAFLLIPLSMLFIKYYPGLGKSYSRFTGTSHYQGVTLGKNMLGATVLVLTLFLIWELIQIFRKQSKVSRRTEILSYLGLAVMGVWLLRIANSATSLACAILGSAALVGLGMEFIRKRLKNLVAYCVLGALGLMILSTVVDLGAAAAGMLGRDSSLTGRDEIWKAVLAEKTNPVIGTGFYSFWLGSRSEKLSEKNHYHFRLNQAHNGYLELYLNGGVIGVCLLLAVLISAGKNIKQQLLVNADWAGLRLVIWLIVIMHNWSEASFCRVGPLWFVLLMVTLEYPRAFEAVRRRSPTSSYANLPKPEQETVPAQGTPLVGGA